MVQKLLFSLAVCFFFQSGCQKVPESVKGTGAKELTQEYYEAVINRDWSKAYDFLDSKTRAQSSLQQYSRLGQSFVGKLGFEPTAVRIRSCEEHGDTAIVHLTINGRGTAKSSQFKESITLRRDQEGWRIVMQPNFGR